MKDPHYSLPSPENDEIIFAQEDEEIPITLESSESNDSWKILIVDDDAVVHEVTKLALTDFVLERKSLTFISAYSAKESKTG